MHHVAMLITYALVAALIVFYASAVVVMIVNVVAGAAMDTAFPHDQRRPREKMD